MRDALQHAVDSKAQQGRRELSSLFHLFFQRGGRFHVDTTLQNNAARHLLFSFFSRTAYSINIGIFSFLSRGTAIPAA